MVESWLDVCVSNLFCVVVVVNHVPWESIELERLSKSFVWWAVMVVGQSEQDCSAGGCLVGWAIVVTVVDGWVLVVRLYRGKSFSALPMRLLLACRMQL